MPSTSEPMCANNVVCVSYLGSVTGGTSMLLQKPAVRLILPILPDNQAKRVEFRLPLDNVAHNNHNALPLSGGVI